MKIFIRGLCNLLLLISSYSLALPPTVRPELEVSLAGSGSQDQALSSLIKKLCNPNSIDFFNVTGADRLETYNAYFCSVSISKLTMPVGIAALGNLAARDINSDGVIDVLIYKNSNGGTGDGVLDLCGDISVVTHQLPVYRMSDGETFCAQSINDAHIWACGFPAVEFPAHVADGITIDLEMNKLPIPYNSVCDGAAPFVSSQGKSGYRDIWGTIFNTPISLNFRNALQCAQGLTVGAEDEANMPSLPKSIIASIYNGGIANWNTIQAKDAAGNYTALSVAVNSRVAAGMCPGYSIAVNPIPSDTRVRACRGVQNSSINTQFRIKFLNAICSSQAQDILGDNTPNSSNFSHNNNNWQTVTPNIATAPAMIEASSNDYMARCISAFSDASSPATQRWAIGIMSLQNNINRVDNYRFIKIDGIAPTLENVLQNKYFDWVESAWLWKNPITQDQKDAIDFQQILQKGTGSATVVGSLVQDTFIHSFGASGLVALNTVPGNTPNLPINPANPVATSSHAVGTLSSCKTPQIKVNSSF